MKRFWDVDSGHASQCPDVRGMLRLLSKQLTLELLFELAGASKDVSAVADALELDMTSISRNLKQMHSYALVDVKRHKQQHLYSVGSGVNISLNGVDFELSIKTADGGQIAVKVPKQRI